MTDALFRINGDSSDQGFDAANSQVLTFTIKTLPIAGVRTWELQVFDADAFVATNAIDKNPPRQSPGAPELTLVGATSGQRVSPTVVTGSITATMPASGSHSWIVRSIVNGGTGLDGRPDPNLVHQRMVAIRNVNNVRQIIATETREYSNDGWAQAVNEALGLAASTDYPGVPVQRYLPAASFDMCNATAAALLANPSASRFVFPSGEWVWTRRLDRSDGLRDNLIFEGHNTRFRVPAELAAMQIFLQFTETTEPVNVVHFDDITFINDSPTLGMHAFYGYTCSRVTANRVKLITPAITPASPNGTRLSWTCNGSRNCAMVNSYLERAQAGFCGIGQSARNVLFAHNIGKDAVDFMVSVVGGEVGDESDFIENVTIDANICDGVLGGGVAFVGSDGSGALSVGKLTGIKVINNNFRGAKATEFADAPRMIRGHAGRVTRDITFSGNSLYVDGGDDVGGIYFTNTIDSGPVDGLYIDDNNIDQTDTLSSVAGIDLPTLQGSRMYIRRNIMKGGRGLFLEDMDDINVEDNRLIGAAISAKATTRNVTGWRFRRNVVGATGAFTSAITFGNSASHTFLDVIVGDGNELTSASGDALQNALSGGSLAVQLLNNPKLGSIAPAMRAAITRAVNNPDFV